MEENKGNDPDFLALNKILRGLPEMAEAKIRLSEIFRSIHQKINRGFFYQEILDDVFASLETVIPFDRMGIALIENEGRTIRLNWVKSKLPIHSLRKGYSSTLEGSSLEQIINTEKSRIIDDLEEYLRIHPDSKSTALAIQDGIRSSLTLPLIANGRPIGMLFFSSGKPFTFNDSHIDLFSEISEGLSLIIEHGYLKLSLDDLKSKEKNFRSTIHDLSNPLSVIQGTLDKLSKEDWLHQLGDDSNNSLRILKRNCESMINLVHDLKQIETITKGKKSIQLSKISIDHFLNEILSDSEIMASRKNIYVNLVKDDNVPETASFDHFKLKDAIANLVSNAIKYSKKNTHISIHVSMDGCDKLCFAVSDQGQGIPESELPKLFHDFGKTSVRPTAGETSTGLGLSNVKRHIEAHGGEVSVKSQVGIGSTFSFWIPLIA